MNQQRLLDELLTLLRIDSISLKEGEIAQYLKERLEELKLQVMIDKAGEAVFGQTGNVIAKLPGTLKGAKPLMINAHMDTVVPGEGVNPIVEDDLVKTDGRTVLGADDKAGIAIILEVIRALKEQNISHGPLDIVFTIGEETGLLGAKHLDYNLITARHAIVLDSGDVEKVTIKCPSANRMTFRIHGREAHAGSSPEKGINAIALASRAITNMRLGKIDEETTANVGIINGGTATNIVPGLVEIRAEARSRNKERLREQTEHMVRCFREAVENQSVEVDGKVYTASLEEKVTRDYNAINLSEDDLIVKTVLKAATNLNWEFSTRVSGGGSDANIFNERGIQATIIGVGFKSIHTLEEYINVNDIARSAELLLEIIKTFANDGGA